MQINEQKALDWKLEETSEPIKSFRNNGFINWSNRFWRSIIRYLNSQDEPKIWQSKDWFGHTWWNVYLPKPDRTARFASEDEVRIWLEENLRF